MFWRTGKNTGKSYIFSPRTTNDVINISRPNSVDDARLLHWVYGTIGHAWSRNIVVAFCHTMTTMAKSLVQTVDFYYRKLIRKDDCTRGRAIRFAITDVLVIHFLRMTECRPAVLLLCSSCESLEWLATGSCLSHNVDSFKNHLDRTRQKMQTQI